MYVLITFNKKGRLQRDKWNEICTYMVNSFKSGINKTLSGSNLILPCHSPRGILYIVLKLYSEKVGEETISLEVSKL